MVNEEKKKKRISNLVEGTTINGQIIKEVYFYDDERNYIIFKNDKGEVRYFGSAPVSEINSYLGECNFLREMSHGNRIKKWVDYQKASALNEFFLGKNDDSIEILNKCMEVIRQKEIARKKLIYIGAYLGITILLLIIWMIIKMKCPEFEYLEYVSIALFGAFGGFISLNYRLEKVDFCISEGTVSYIMVSIYKMAFACISGIVFYLLIQSDIILSAVKESTGVTYVVATVAGFSERLLPNIFAKIENDVSEKE